MVTLTKTENGLVINKDGQALGTVQRTTGRSYNVVSETLGLNGKISTSKLLKKLNVAGVQVTSQQLVANFLGN